MLRIIFTILTVACGLNCLAEDALLIDDMQSAREWCDNTSLQNIEGIWEFPEDMTRVLVSRDMITPYRYNIILIDSPDTRLIPGETIGYMQASASPAKFEMGIYRTKLNKKLSQLGKCLAQLDDKNGAILVSGRKISFSIGSRWLLPSFWRLVKLSLKDPLESLPKGLVKVYPNPVRSFPDYL